MNFQEYAEWTNQTVVYKKEIEIPYLIMGFIDEFGEAEIALKGYLGLTEYEHMHEAYQTLCLELGDVMYYIARIYDAFSKMGFDTSLILEAITSSYRLNLAPTQKLNYISLLAGFTKKYLRDDDNKEKNVTGVIQQVAALTLHVVTHIQTYSTLQDVMNGNKEKLSSRKERGVLKGDGDYR